MFGKFGLVVLAVLGSFSARALEQNPTISVEVAGLAVSLTGEPGDVARGRLAAADREAGNCLLCHTLPIPGERFQGDLGPPLAGIGDRLSAADIRLRLVDAARLNPETIMPPYYRSEGLVRVAPAYQGRSVLTARQIEDIVAYLASLKG